MAFKLPKSRLLHPSSNKYRFPKDHWTFQSSNISFAKQDILYLRKTFLKSVHAPDNSDIFPVGTAVSLEILQTCREYDVMRDLGSVGSDTGLSDGFIKIQSEYIESPTISGRRSCQEPSVPTRYSRMMTFLDACEFRLLCPERFQDIKSLDFMEWSKENFICSNRGFGLSTVPGPGLIWQAMARKLNKNGTEISAKNNVTLFPFLWMSSAFFWSYVIRCWSHEAVVRVRVQFGTVCSEILPRNSTAVEVFQKSILLKNKDPDPTRTDQKWLAAQDLGLLESLFRFLLGKYRASKIHRETTDPFHASVIPSWFENFESNLRKIAWILKKHDSSLMSKSSSLYMMSVFLDENLLSSIKVDEWLN